MASKTYKGRENLDALFADFPAQEGLLGDQGRLGAEGRSMSPHLRGVPPESVSIPPLADMKRLSIAELDGILEAYGVGTPWPSMVNEMQQYVARMTELQPGTPAFRQEVERLFDPEGPLAKRHMLSMARRVDQTWSMLDAADGDMNAEFVWITEFDEAVCPACEENGGLENTLLGWYAEGMPGPGVCFGGGMCRCDLVRVSE